ncbi:MAG: exodeoxyribonuclease III, partial [Candidatus Heimdallarchaeaceae archaeon]
MVQYTLISWNVNGIRAVAKKELYQGLKFNEWLNKTQPMILAVQETKAQPEQLQSGLLNPQGYYSYWNSAERKGYSGVAIFTKEKPLEVNFNLGIEKFDKEGRFIEMKFPKFLLFNVYFPNGKLSKERLEYKLEFYEVFLEYIE